ncbi:MAG TPA: efflux RND transporter periplasmic adaptor subunit [Steroidobacteraceae bacterium]
MRYIVALVLIVGAVLAWALMRQPATPASTQPAVVAPLELSQVDVAIAEPRALSRRLPLSGSLAPVVLATVKSKVGGEVRELTVREGQDVREGEVIARLDTRNLQAQYDRELAAVEKARADLELATLNREKNRALLEQKFISQNTFEQTETAYFGSVANLKLAEAQARLAKINLDDAVIRAPFSGTIARRLVQPGEKVSPDAPVVQIVDLREMLLEAAVPATEIPAVRIGQTARFTVGGFGEREFVGNVQRINPITTDGSRAITIYVAVPNPDLALKGGMFAQGELILDADEPVLSIPYAAVRFEAGSPIVHMLVDGKIERREIVLGPHVEGSEFVEVRSGVKSGERVIVADIGDHKPGDAAFVRGEELPTSIASSTG